MKFRCLLPTTFVLLYLAFGLSIKAIGKPHQIEEFFRAYPEQVKMVEKKILSTFPILKWCDCDTLIKDKNNTPFYCKIYSRNKGKNVHIIFRMNSNMEYDPKNELNYYFKISSYKKIGMCYVLTNKNVKTQLLCKYDFEYKELRVISSLLVESRLGKKLTDNLLPISHVVNWMIMDRIERCTYIEF